MNDEQFLDERVDVVATFGAGLALTRRRLASPRHDRRVAGAFAG